MDAIAAAETSVLGVCFIGDRKTTADISQRLDPNDFFEPRNRAVFSSIRTLIDMGEDVNTISVLNRLQAAGVDISSGRGPNIDFIHSIESSVATSLTYGSYIDVIKEGSRRRRAKGLLSQAISALSEHGSSVDETLGALFSEIATEGTSDGVRVKSLGEVVQSAIGETKERFDSGNQIVGIKTGLEELDQLTGGLKPKRMYIVMGATGRGKTCLALNIVNCAMKDNFKVLHVSLEMSGSDLAKRLMSMRAKVDGMRIENGNLSGDDFDKIVYAVRELKKQDNLLSFIDTNSLTTSQLRRELMKMDEKERPNLLVIDYLQLMRGDSGSSGNQTRQQQIAKISADLLGIAKDFNVCVLSLSQQNKEGKARESADIENDASGIMKIEYEDIAEGPRHPAPNVVINMEKHRYGDMGRARATFFRSHQLFVNRRDY